MNQKFMERASRLNEILKQKGAPFQVEHLRNFKNNVFLDSYILKSDLFHASPIVYYDEKWWTKSDEDVASFLLSMFDTHACPIDVSPVHSPSYVRENIKPRLISASNVPALKENEFAFIPYLDMVITFYVTLPIGFYGKQQKGSIVLPLPLLENLNISLDDALKCAIRNIEDLVKITPITSVLPVPLLGDIDCKMMVINTPMHNFGASAILSDITRQRLAEQLGDKIVLLPSSIHEFIACPYESENDFSVLRDMVASINQLEVAIEEVLTDNVYLLENGKVRNVF